MPTDRTAFDWKGNRYIVQRLDSAKAVIDETALLFEGWEVLCDKNGARADIDWEDYLQRMLNIATTAIRGAIFVYRSKNGKPLGYTVLIDDTESKRHPTVFVYAGYSKGLLASGGKMAMEFVCKWARVNGYAEIRTQSRRLNGAAFRYFRKTLGFRMLSAVFTKDI